jgi:hypothetical protein
MKHEFTTSRQDTIKIYASSNIHYRVWLKIEENFAEKEAATELSIWDIDILIASLAKARKSLQERSED